MNEAAMRSTIVPTRRKVGNLSSTLVLALNSIFALSLRNIKRIMSALTIAPASTTQNIPGFPLSTKKSEKSRLADFARRIEVVSPTSVAAPWRFEDTAMQMIDGTGEMLTFLQKARATGAIMSTVATLSTNAETIPAKSERQTIAHLTFGIFEMRMSDMSCGIFDSMKR